MEMTLSRKVKTDFEAGRICKEVAECIAAIAMGNQGLFEHQDGSAMDRAEAREEDIRLSREIEDKTYNKE